MASARAGIIVLFALCWTTLVSANPEHSSELRQLDEQIQQLKLQALQLDLDYKQYEDTSLYPPSQQLRVFVSMDVYDFVLNTAELHSNDIELTSHVYTPREVYALRKGGVQELYLGNVSPGVHKLQVKFVGRFEDAEENAGPISKTVEVSFRKTESRQWLELRIDDTRQGDLKVRVFQREDEQ